MTLCPGAIVTFTCHDSNVTAMSWLVESYMQTMVTFLPGFIYHNINDSVFISQGIDSRFVGTVVSIDFQEENKEFADNIITTFRVVPIGLDNGTRVTCRTLDEEEVFHSSTKLYFAGIHIAL